MSKHFFILKLNNEDKNLNIDGKQLKYEFIILFNM